MIISSGCLEFDVFLQNGYETGLSLIYGVAATGKTTLGILAACKEAEKNKVLFIDTEGGFSAERVKQICGEDVKTVLENILILRVSDFDEQEEKINNVLKLAEGVKCRLVILDTLGMYYRKKLQEENPSLVNARVRKMLDNLERLAKHRDIAVLIMNQVYQDVKGEIKMVGSDMVKKRAGKCIYLAKDHGRYAIFDGKKFKFEIYDKGIRKIG